VVAQFWRAKAGEQLRRQKKARDAAAKKAAGAIAAPSAAGAEDPYGRTNKAHPIVEPERLALEQIEADLIEIAEHEETRAPESLAEVDREDDEDPDLPPIIDPQILATDLSGVMEEGIEEDTVEVDNVFSENPDIDAIIAQARLDVDEDMSAAMGTSSGPNRKTEVRRELIKHPSTLITPLTRKSVGFETERL
jgi:hypothetical protein